jgi:hypothetical protein
MVGSTSEEPILRAKYLDWCSARIAERFLALSPDEIYQRAERASHASAETADAAPPLLPFYPPNPNQPDWHAAIAQAVTAVADTGSEEAISFRNLVVRLTGILADEMELPTFEEWAAAYSEAPEEFDPEMLGFWKENAGS